MSFNDKSKAERLVTVARSQLLRGRPEKRGAFFGVLAMRLELVEDPKLKRPMQTDGHVLRFQPDAIVKMQSAHLLSLVAQAVTRCAAGHHVRRGGRTHVALYDQAGEFVVNPELKQAGFQLPDEALYDPRFENMSIERVYSILESEMPPSSGQSDEQQEGEGKGSGQQGKSKSKSKQDKNKDKDKDKEDRWGCGVEPPKKERPEPGEGEGDDGDESEGDRPMSREEMEKEAHDWSVAAVQAAAVAQKQGLLPAFAERLIEKIMRPKHDPWVVLRQFVAEQLTSDYRWSPPNRRFVSQGYYFPSLRSDDALGEIVVIVDTSGSIDIKTLNEFAQHVGAIIEDYRPRRTILIMADAAVNRVDYFERDEPFMIKPAGGGGTDFRPAFRWIDKNMIDPPAVCCYLSDGYGTFLDRAPDYPVIWAMTTDVKAPHGETIHIRE